MTPAQTNLLDVLHQHARILQVRIRHPRTCPRRAIEAEEELARLRHQIAALTASTSSSPSSPSTINPQPSTSPR